MIWKKKETNKDSKYKAIIDFAKSKDDILWYNSKEDYGEEVEDKNGYN